MNHTHTLGLHRFAVFVAGATLFLIVAGASVTSTGSGLAVPDWPLSFGQFFPPMVGGVFYEHGHRMIAGVVLVLTVVLTAWLLRRDERPAVRKLGVAALAALITQAVLGGMTVLFQLPTLISVSHAGLAQIFFCMIVAIALITSPRWRDTERAADAGGAMMLQRLAIVTTVIVYLQILVGALMRHTGAGLAIPDFPLSYGRVFPPYLSPPIVINYIHRVGAFVVFICAIALLLEIGKNHRTRAEITRPGLLLAGLLTAQIVLGALTIWSRRAVLPTTLHVGMGAAVLAVSLVLTLRAYRPVSSGVETQPSTSYAGSRGAQGADGGARGALASAAVGGFSAGGGKS